MDWEDNVIEVELHEDVTHTALRNKRIIGRITFYPDAIQTFENGARWKDRISRLGHGADPAILQKSQQFFSVVGT